MEMMQTVAEAVIVAFLVGAIFGGVLTIHLVSKRQAGEVKTNES